MNTINKENIDKCIRDLKKISEAEKLMTGLEQMKDRESNLERYLRYVLNNNIVSSLEEVFYLVQQLPEVANTFARIIRESDKARKLIDLKIDTVLKEYHRNPYAGTYDRIEDAPGYGTHWNERCIPDGVTIRGRNDSSCRC